MSTRGMRAASPEAPVSGERSLRLPLLLERLDAIQPGVRQQWMDFGRVQPALLARLSEGRNRIVVGDLVLQDREDAPPVSLQLLDRTSEPEAFDVLLTWDWLNHLDPDSLRRVGARLARHAAPGACLHALIYYSTDAMPAHPLDYRLTDNGEVRVPNRPTGPRPAPRYSPKALEKAMPQWQVDRTMLLNNGMQEFVLCRRDGEDGST